MTITARFFGSTNDLLFAMASLGCLMMIASSTHAQTIYRCTTPTGQPLFSNLPCNANRPQGRGVEPGASADNTSRSNRLAQLRSIASSEKATSEQKAAAFAEMNRYERGDCQMSADDEFLRDRLYVRLAEGASHERERARHDLISLLDACFSGRRDATRISQPATLAAPAAAEQTVSSRDGKIYRCKTSQGGYFWASNWCSSAGAATIDVINVPVGMSFKEQAVLADQVIASRHRSSASESSVRDQGVQCGAIDRELGEIRSRYADAQYVPVDQVNRDQLRQRDLQARRRSLRCAAR